VPEDKHWLIGFRLVLGPRPTPPPLPPAPPLPYQLRVSQAAPDAAAGTQAVDAPYFRGPRTYVNIPPQSCGPLYSKHNHDPALAVCPNGDLLAIWYSGLEEPNRELCLLASRLRHGQDAWDPASPFWDAPDRNCHAPALWRDEQGTLYHFCGLSTGATWGSCALMMRRSRDNGVTWSKPRLIAPEHGLAPPHKSDHMPVACVFRMRNGAIVLPCDAGGNTVLHISRDNGETWEESEGTIRGIHAGVAELKDGRILAFGRTQIKDARMTMSVSEDMGRSWQYRASVFPDITWSQRAILIRLREGPLFLASFAGQSTVYDAQGKPATKDNGADMAVNDAAGRPRKIRGLFGALSFDEGETWPVCRVITGESAPKRYPLNRGNYFMMDAGTGEPEGYLTASQAPGGLIHLITSQRHYAFNAAWLKTPMPAIS